MVLLQYPTACEPLPPSLFLLHHHTHRAVGILKEGVATDCITLLVARDTQSQSEFKRLSQDFDRSPPQLKGIQCGLS